MTTRDQRNVTRKKQFDCKLCTAFKRLVGNHRLDNGRGIEVEMVVQAIDTTIAWQRPPHTGEVVGICRGCAQLFQGYISYQVSLAQARGEVSRIIVPGPGVIK